MPGFCEACVTGQHSECHDPQCRCLCRPSVQALMAQSPHPVSTTSVGTLVCPQCSRVPRNGDQFCRTDGTKLISGKICRCGKAAESDDKFCGGCGMMFGLPAMKVQE